MKTENTKIKTIKILIKTVILYQRYYNNTEINNWK